HGVNVALEMIHRDQRNALRKGQRLGVGDADQQGASEAWPGSDGDGIKMVECNGGARERLADNGNDGTQVLAAGQLWNDTAVGRVRCNLGSDGGREGACTALDDGRGGFVAGG